MSGEVGNEINYMKNMIAGLQDQISKLSFGGGGSQNNNNFSNSNWLLGVAKVLCFSSQYDYEDFPALNILDSSKKYWLSERDKITNQWIVFDFGQVVTLTKISIQVDNFECTVKDCQLEVSDNDELSNWKAVTSFTVQCGTQNQGEQFFDGFNAKARFFRLMCKNAWGIGGGAFILVSNVRFCGEISKVQPNNRALYWLDDLVYLHSFSSQHSDITFEARNVLDRTKTYWLSETGKISNQWFIFDFRKPVLVTRIVIQVDNFECSLKDFIVEESNDNYTWRFVREFQAKNGTTCQTEQLFEGFEIKSRYIRLFCKNNWGSGGGQFILIKLIRFYGCYMQN